MTPNQSQSILSGAAALTHARVSRVSKCSPRALFFQPPRCKVQQTNIDVYKNVMTTLNSLVPAVDITRPPCAQQPSEYAYLSFRSRATWSNWRIRRWEMPTGRMAEILKTEMYLHSVRLELWEIKLCCHLQMRSLTELQNYQVRLYWNDSKFA